MVIHFFKHRSERVDFEELIDGYFNNMNDVEITGDDNECRIIIGLADFNFSYHYLITKRSQVSSIYKLNYDFVNINMLVDIPVNLPQFIIKIILKQIEEMCRKFGFAIYHNLLDNISDFNLFSMLEVLLKERTKFLLENKDVVYYKLKEQKLNAVCIYQKVLKDLPQIVNCHLMSNPYIVMVDKETGDVKLSINWRVSEPTVFPPELNYVHVEEEENLVNIVPIEIFKKYVGHYLYEIKDSTTDLKLSFLNEKYSSKAKKYLKKMRKYMISSTNFFVVKLTNLIEE